MEQAILVSTILAILLPYFGEAGKAFAGKAGEAAWGKCEAIYQAIKSKFKGKPAAEEALVDLESDPSDGDNRAAFRKELRKALEADGEFFENLQKLVSEAQQVIGIEVSGSGAVATTYGTAAGENGIAIGGDIKGDVNIDRKKTR